MGGSGKANQLLHQLPQALLQGMGSQNNLVETLTNLRDGYESVIHEANMYKMQRDELDRKRTCNGEKSPTLLSLD